MAVRKIEHVGIMVKDLEKSIAFYREVIGLELVSTLTHTKESLKLAFLSFPGAKETQVELIQGYNDRLPQEGKVHHLAFTVDDIQKEWDRLKQLDISFIDDEIVSLPNGSKYFFFHGPDGEWIEFFEPA
ncbi:VOC family protein [Polycladomyces subterraneus]|uniref:VOC family protein n=1 Tax=Polycladomyces subterraneus TaxID=1016997 RepID=A0ABT8III2_9BACL|nr:VOC family protein [Polycladomyces subterraneus]MDN4592601.1 VOC family protein [Polycladomyces subterraneus]